MLLFFFLSSLLLSAQELPKGDIKNFKPLSGKNSKEITLLCNKCSTCEPLYVLNGKISTKESISKIDTKTIEKVFILKDKKAIEKYGEKAKNGVIEISTKNKNEKTTI